MKAIAIYNNKGGVGKSTTTLFLADFFSSLKIAGKNARVLVVDFDSQASSATSLLGLQAVAKMRSEKRCLSHMLLKGKSGEGVLLSRYLSKREKGHSSSKKNMLGEVWVMSTERDSTIKLEKSCNQKHIVKFVKLLREGLSDRFDFVFIDIPANIDERNILSLTGLLLSDHILIPTEPSRISINPLVDTFNIIQYVRGMAAGNHSVPNIIGVLLNKTDRRTKQYKLHNKELSEMAANQNTVIFENFLPIAPTLSSASDDSIEFATLKDRYITYYDNVRKVAVELAVKCGYKVKTRNKN